MRRSTSLGQAWAAFWTLRRQRPESAWARLLVANALAFALSAALVALAGLLRLAWFDLAWWKSVAIPVLGIGLAIGNTLLFTFRAFELTTTPATLERLAHAASWRAGLLINTLAAWGIVAGCAIGIGLVSILYDPAFWQGLADPRRQIHLALVILVLIIAHGSVWSLRARQRGERRRATETQLHLLQAHIEPQFLFNTLADVQDLLDHDPAAASRMLDEFTSYLRASLIGLHRTSTSLASELDLAHCYLQLQRHRNGDGWGFSIEASVQARLAVVPPGLLQPMLEHALGHGATSCPARSGAVQIKAGVRLGQLEITVAQDGAPLSRTPAEGSPALENLRARLQARYGSGGSLTWTTQAGGAHAMLALPLVGVSVDSSQQV